MFTNHRLLLHDLYRLCGQIAASSSGQNNDERADQRKELQGLQRDEAAGHAEADC